mmetsp:Transcript_18242/g.32241  ORF Transcript_18242/g.32241 Transcript_18242/m.32241 type:complete len:418 (-) Transcript_18242:102-1355(-)
MEVNLQVNSSLVLGLLAGAGISLVFAGQCKASAKKLGIVCCPIKLAEKLGLRKAPAASSAARCPASGVSAASGAKCPASTPAASQSSEEKGTEEERAAEREAFWFKEGLTDVFRIETALKSILFDGRSTFQRVQVIDTEQFGRTLVLDGQTQSAEADEHIYHESLVHPAMLLHGNPKSVFIGGGGEGATAREVLRHDTVERCVMVDIDELACKICHEQLPEWNTGVYEDSRFDIRYEDAYQWLKDTDEKFDVIIMDICDPIEAGPGYKLYTSEFYTFLRERLNDGGVFVTQSGPGAVYNAKEECFTVINSTLRSAFDVVVPYAVDVPSFGCNWGFNLARFAREDEDAVAAKDDILNYSVDAMNKSIETHISGGAAEMHFLDGWTWRGMTGLPKQIRVSCTEEDRVMTIDNPVFMYSS